MMSITLLSNITDGNTIPIAIILVAILSLHYLIEKDTHTNGFEHALAQFVFILGIIMGYNMAAFDSELIPSILTIPTTDVASYVNLGLVSLTVIVLIISISIYLSQYIHIGKKEQNSPKTAVGSSESTTSDEDQSQDQDQGPPPIGQITESESVDEGPGPHTTNIPEENEND